MSLSCECFSRFDGAGRAACGVFMEHKCRQRFLELNRLTDRLQNKRNKARARSIGPIQKEMQTLGSMTRDFWLFR